MLKRGMLIGGFTLIEILVTLAIMMFGMLGLAGLMARGQRASYEAYQRNQALWIANDMAERIKANRQEQISNSTYTNASLGQPLGDGSKYSQLLASGIKDCISNSCSASELAAWDIANWDGLLQGSSENFGGSANLIGGITNARGCIEIPVGAPVNTVRVTIVWQGDASTRAPTSASTCGSTILGANRHVVSLDTVL